MRDYEAVNLDDLTDAEFGEAAALAHAMQHANRSEIGAEWNELSPAAHERWYRIAHLAIIALDQHRAGGASS